MRVALMGAYGAGKTTLAAALSPILGIPTAHGTPMDKPIGGDGRGIADCTDAELIQLTVRRFLERVVAEERAGGRFVSDGSALHEWIYGRMRLAVGSYPSVDVDVGDVEIASSPYLEVLDQIGLLMKAHFLTYDLVIHLPVEFPLADAHPPINERFRSLSDDLLLSVTKSMGVPLCTVTGNVEQRILIVKEIVQAR